MKLSAILLWFNAFQQPPPADVPDEARFASYRLGDWHIEAYTDVETWVHEGQRYPVARNVRCVLTRDGLIIDTDRTGRTRVNIIRVWDDGARAFSARNIHGLRLGRIDYRARGIDTSHGPYRFSDVTYPTPEFGAVLISQFSGYLAVQRGGDGPWISVDQLLDEMFRTSSLRVTYRVRSGENGWTLERHTIPLDGLSAAFERCGAEIASPNSLRLRQR